MYRKPLKDSDRAELAKFDEGIPPLPRELAVIDPNLPEEADFGADGEEEGVLPDINGHKITMREYNTFRTYIGCNGIILHTANESGVSRAQIYRWKDEAWWKWLEEKYIAHAQRRTHLVIAQRSHKAAEALFHVMDGISPEDKTAGAKVNAARTVLEIGNDPLIKKTPSLQVNQNIINNHGTLNINKLKLLPPERIHEITESGIIPDEVMDF